MGKGLVDLPVAVFVDGSSPQPAVGSIGVRGEEGHTILSVDRHIDTIPPAN
jgi:hypothetical protein